MKLSCSFPCNIYAMIFSPVEWGSQDCPEDGIVMEPYTFVRMRTSLLFECCFTRNLSFIFERFCQFS